MLGSDALTLDCLNYLQSAERHSSAPADLELA